MSLAAGSWSMRTAPACAFQSAAVQGTSPLPVEYPADCPIGRWPMLAWMESQTVTVLTGRALVPFL